jgi:hypothetical protein
VDGKDRVEQVRQPDAVGFGNQSEKGSIAVEAPGPALLDYFKTRLIVSVEQRVVYFSGWSLVDEFKGF